MQVLATMIEEAQADQPGQAQKEVSATLWQLISDALAAGAATLSTTAAAAARQPVGLQPVSCHLKDKCASRHTPLDCGDHTVSGVTGKRR